LLAISAIETLDGNVFLTPTFGQQSMYRNGQVIEIESLLG